MRKLKSSTFHLPYRSDLVGRAKELRQNMTPAESKLWHEYLKHFPFRVLRQRPIDHFIADFYCARLRLVIEVDGEIHDSEDARAKDLARTQRLESYGLTVIRFTNDEVLDRFDSVCRRIANRLELIPPSPP